MLTLVAEWIFIIASLKAASSPSSRSISKFLVNASLANPCLNSLYVKFNLDPVLPAYSIDCWNEFGETVKYLSLTVISELLNFCFAAHKPSSQYFKVILSPFLSFLLEISSCSFDAYYRTEVDVSIRSLFLQRASFALYSTLHILFEQF